MPDNVKIILGILATIFWLVATYSMGRLSFIIGIICLILIYMKVSNKQT